MSGETGRWLSDHEACVQLGQEIAEKINERNKQPKGTTGYSRSSAHIRTSLQKFSRDIRCLKEDLLRASTQRQVTHRELERRQMLLDSLSTRERQLDEAFRNESHSRSTLLQGGGFGGDPFGSSSQNTDYMNDWSVGEIQQRQQQAIAEQDQGLDALSHIVARQKNMAVDIGNELEDQNELIDDITDHVDRTDHRLIQETRHIRIIDRKSNTCVFWIVIILLMIAIVVIAVVPYNGKP